MVESESYSHASKPRSTIEVDTISAQYSQAIAARMKMVSSWLGDSSSDEEEEEEEEEGRKNGAGPAVQVSSVIPSSSDKDSIKEKKKKTDGDDPQLLFKALPNSKVGLGSKAAKEGSSPTVFNRNVMYRVGAQQDKNGKGRPDTKQLSNSLASLNTIRNQLRRSEKQKAESQRDAPSRNNQDSESESEEEGRNSIGNKRKVGGKVSYFDQRKNKKKR